ncbi:hypothetical protein ACFSTC_33680 [Nonomuraea ferruginea]
MDIDLADLDFWRRPLKERHEAFARLRQLDHPVFFPEKKVPFLRSGAGFYALVRHADVVEASRNAKVFSSELSRHQPRAARLGQAGVRRVDGQHGRPATRPAAPHRDPLVQPQDARGAAVRHRVGLRAHRRRRRRAGAARLRPAGRRPAAHPRHLRHARHSARVARTGPQARRHLHRLHRHPAQPGPHRPDGRAEHAGPARPPAHGDQAGPRTRRRPQGRPGLPPGHRQPRRREAHLPRARLVLRAAAGRSATRPRATPWPTASSCSPTTRRSASCS